MSRRRSHWLPIAGLIVVLGAVVLLVLSGSVSNLGLELRLKTSGPSPTPVGQGRPAPLQVQVPRVGPLQPGVGQRLDVVVVNPNTQAVMLTGVDVQVSQVRGTQVSSKRPCGVVDFRGVSSRFDGVVVRPGARVSLTQAGIPTQQWPRVEMLDSAVNQDGCKSAQLVLDVHAAGRFA